MESLHQAQGDISSMMSTVDSLDNLLSTHQYVIILLICFFLNNSILFFYTFVNIIHCFLAIIFNLHSWNTFFLLCHDNRPYRPPTNTTTMIVL